MRRFRLITTFLVAALLAATCLSFALAGQARSAASSSDVTPPFGGVQLPKSVNTTSVSLLLKLSDPDSGVVAVRVSNDGATFSDWMALPSPTAGASYPVLPWTLSDGDGPKTITVEARNGAGLVGTFVANTTLDTVAPVFLTSEPVGGAALAAPPTGLTLHFSEPLALSPAPRAVLADGTSLVAVAIGNDVSVTPRAPLLPGAAYAVTVSGVRDRAGNSAEPVEVRFTVAPGMPSLKAVATPATVTYGSSVVISGSLNVPGAAVGLSAKAAGESDYTPVANTTASAQGSFSFSVRPALNTGYRVTFAGDQHWLEASVAVDVKVRPRIALTATPAEFLLHKQTVLQGAIAPVHAGATVVIQRQVKGQWTNWQTLVTDAEGHFSFTWQPTSYGIRYFRAQIAADGEHAAGLSPSRRVVVDNPNPHHISVLYRHFIVIDISECRLYYYESGRVVRTFPVVLGKPSTPTPRGQWAIYSKSVNPGGPFGAYAMFYYRGYGIHGTNQEYLLSLWPRYFSHGCCRLYNSAISWLYPRCPIGTPVRNVW